MAKNRFSKITRGAMIAGLWIGLGTGIAQAHSLADTLTLAYRSSGLLDQNRALLRAADEDVAQSLAAVRPIISWSVGMTATRAEAQYDASRQVVATDAGTVAVVNVPAGTNISTNISANADLSLSLMLYDYGKSQFATEAAKEIVLATRQTLRKAEQDVLLRGVQAHMQVRRALEALELRRSNVRVIQKELKAAKDRFEVGEVTRTDVSFAEARLAAARSQVASAEGDYARAAEEYRAVTGQMPKSLKAAKPAKLGRSLDSARAFAVQNHPSVIEQRHNVSAAELTIRRAEAAMKPSVNLNAGVGLNQNLDTNQRIGITIGGPIYQGGALTSQVRQAMARRDAARAGLHQVSIGVEQQVGNAYSLLRVTQLGREASDQQIRAARSAFDGIREEAKLGSRTTLDVLNAEQDLLDARVQSLSTQIDQVIASYNVLAAMGLLTADYLNLPVQQYDPEAYYNLVKDAPAARSRQGEALDRVLRSIGD